MKTPLIGIVSFVFLILGAASSHAQLNLPWEKLNKGKAPAPAAAVSSNPQASPAAQPASDEPPAQINSPDGASSVRILQKAMPGTDGVTDFFTLEVLQGDKVVARAPTEGYLLSAYWSADGRLLAVNNRRGNSGDYLWVFSLPDGNCIKKADDELGQIWLAAALKEIQGKFTNATAETVYKNWLSATGGSASNELHVNVRVRYSKTGTFDCDIPALFQNGKWNLQPGSVQPVQ